MQELDQWTQEVIIEPMMENLGGVIGVEMNLQSHPRQDATELPQRPSCRTNTDSAQMAARGSAIKR